VDATQEQWKQIAQVIKVSNSGENASTVFFCSPKSSSDLERDELFLIE
jgi:hypothetical protein